MLQFLILKSKFLENKKSLGHRLIKLEFYDGEILCTKIVVDFTDETLSVENTTDNIEDLLHKNGLVYNFAKKRLAKFDEISNNNIIGQDIYCVSSYYLLQPGSFIKTEKLVSYFCRYNFSEFIYKGIELK